MQKFKEYGIKAHMTSYDVLLSYPLKRELHMLAPIEFSPLLRESVEGEDPQSRSPKEVDTFLAYAKSGGSNLGAASQCTLLCGSKNLYDRGLQAAL